MQPLSLPVAACGKELNLCFSKLNFLLYPSSVSYQLLFMTL
jgi:hypothetical protein